MLDWTSRDGGIQEESFIQRIEALSTMGYSVLLSNYSRYFSLASYLSTFTKQSIVISMGIPSVRVGFIQSWSTMRMHTEACPFVECFMLDVCSRQTHAS